MPPQTRPADVTCGASSEHPPWLLDVAEISRRREVEAWHEAAPREARS